MNNGKDKKDKKLTDEKRKKIKELQAQKNKSVNDNTVILK